MHHRVCAEDLPHMHTLSAQRCILPHMDTLSAQRSILPYMGHLYAQSSVSLRTRDTSMRRAVSPLLSRTPLCAEQCLFSSLGHLSAQSAVLPVYTPLRRVLSCPCTPCGICRHARHLGYMAGMLDTYCRTGRKSGP